MIIISRVRIYTSSFKILKILSHLRQCKTGQTDHSGYVLTSLRLTFKLKTIYLSHHVISYQPSRLSSRRPHRTRSMGKSTGYSQQIRLYRTAGECDADTVGKEFSINRILRSHFTILTSDYARHTRRPFKWTYRAGRELCCQTDMETPNLIPKNT